MNVAFTVNDIDKYIDMYIVCAYGWEILSRHIAMFYTAGLSVLCCPSIQSRYVDVCSIAVPC